MVRDLATSLPGATAPRHDGHHGAAARMRAWVPALMLNIALPTFTYILLTGRGTITALAFAASGVWPVVDASIAMARGGRADPVNVIALAVVVLGALTSLAFHDARLALVKNATLTGLFGVVLLASLVRGRPLMFYFGRRFATDGSPAQVARWNGYWQYPEFRRAQRILTVVWAAGFIAEAVAEVIVSEALPTAGALAVNNVLPYAVLGALICGTAVYGKRGRARAMAARRTAGGEVAQP